MKQKQNNTRKIKTNRKIKGGVNDVTAEFIHNISFLKLEVKKQNYNYNSAFFERTIELIRNPQTDISLDKEFFINFDMLLLNYRGIMIDYGGLMTPENREKYQEAILRCIIEYLRRFINEIKHHRNILNIEKEIISKYFCFNTKPTSLFQKIIEILKKNNDPLLRSKVFKELCTPIQLGKASYIPHKPLQTAIRPPRNTHFPNSSAIAIPKENVIITVPDPGLLEYDENGDPFSYPPISWRELSRDRIEKRPRYISRSRSRSRSRSNLNENPRTRSRSNLNQNPRTRTRSRRTRSNSLR